MVNKKEDFHVDMSGRIYWKRTIGIALVSSNSKTNYGCALKGNLLMLIKKRLFKGNVYEDSAKLYAICIYLLIDNVRNNINTLIICNDEDFRIVKNNLDLLLKDYDFEIINISELRRRFGRNIGSLADNYAKIYRRRALKANKQVKGKKLNVVEMGFNTIKKYWEVLNEKKM